MDTNEEASPKQRHGCVTVWLGFIIVASLGTAVLYLLGSEGIARQLHIEDQAWILFILAGLCILNVVFAVALLNYKKWGFYGFTVNSGLAIVANLMCGLGPRSFTGVIGVIILFGILQIRDSAGVKGWDRLE